MDMRKIGNFLRRFKPFIKEKVHNFLRRFKPKSAKSSSLVEDASPVIIHTASHDSQQPPTNPPPAISQDRLAPPPNNAPTRSQIPENTLPSSSVTDHHPLLARISWNRSQTPENIFASTSPKMATAGNAVLFGLKLFKETVDGIPLLSVAKGPIAGFLNIVETIQAKQAVVEDLHELDRRAKELASRILEPLVGKAEVNIPPDLKRRLDTFAGGITKVLTRVASLDSEDSGSTISAFLNSSENARIIKDIQSEIDKFLSHFTLNHQISKDLLAYEEKLQDHVRRLPCEPVSYKDRLHFPRYPGTAKKILSVIHNWIDADSGPRVLVVHGLAGVGKSTIAQTIAEELELEPGSTKLGASFFFLRSRYDKSNTFFTTITSQLAEYDRSYLSHLGAYLDSVQSIDPRLETQFDKMLSEPLQAIPDSPANHALIVIDALDECNTEGAQKIIKLFTDKAPSIFPKILITCRLETHLRTGLSLSNRTYEGNFDRFQLVDMKSHSVDEDIPKYIRAQLSEETMKKKFPDRAFNVSPDDLLALVEAAGSLFIMASTMIGFIQNLDVYDPHDQLQKLLLVLQKDASIHARPYARLDLVYVTVLQNSFSTWDASLLQNFQTAVGTIVLLQQPLAVPALAALIKLTEEKVDSAIRKLSSVIDKNNDLEAPQIYHASFSDFLTDSARCGDNANGGDNRFFINEPEHHARIVDRCLDIMILHLSKPQSLNLTKHNSGMNREDVPEVNPRDQIDVPEELLYACRFWAIHLSRTEQREGKIVEQLEEFAYNLLLPWMEVLSWAGKLADARAALELVLSWTLRDPPMSSLNDMFSNGQRFLLSFYSMIEDLPKDTNSRARRYARSQNIVFHNQYNEAFNNRVLTPVTTLERRPVQWTLGSIILVGLQQIWVSTAAFSADGKRLASASNGSVVQLWDGVTGQEIAMLQGHQGKITWIAFFLDDKRLASASDDNTIRLWDGITGEQIATLEGHVDDITSVAFSPDGNRLASASFDNTVRLWDGVTGREIAIFQGHYIAVTSVAFSPDGKLLASASIDRTIRFWDLVTGTAMATLRGHGATVTFVAFSPDGKLLASASIDRTIRFWDVVTGTAMATLNGHVDDITSVAFSPDGNRLASASLDRTIRLWDVVTGREIATLEGHGATVTSFAFSPDGNRLASASYDGTLWLRDVVTGETVAKLQGRQGGVRYVAFSPDGKRLVSTSHDNTVQLWDGVTGGEITMLDGHVDKVTSIAFSADSKRLASASYSGTVLLWDGVTGEHVADLQGHRDSITSIDFSPDSERLASTSSDNTVQLWDSVTGAPITKLPSSSRSPNDLPYTPSSRTLTTSTLTYDDFRYVLPSKDSKPSYDPLLWVPAWIRAGVWWLLPAGGSFIFSGNEG